MASYDALVFQPDLFKREMFKICERALDEAVENALTDPKFGGGTQKVLSSSDTYKEVEVTAGSLKAWVYEYGSGLDMDMSNPYLGEYFASGLTSPYRSTPYGLYRGSSNYQSFDVDSGEIVSHKASKIGTLREGKVLPDFYQEKFTRSPQPFMQDMIEECWKVFLIKFESLSNSFDISKCFSVSNITV